jgi:hypothetical protein
MWHENSVFVGGFSEANARIRNSKALVAHLTETKALKAACWTFVLGYLQRDYQEVLLQLSKSET